MDRTTTFLSFWHIDLSNLPLGTVRKRLLSDDEARFMVDEARARETLVCVARDDLGLDARSRARHAELCAALSANAGIEVAIADFFGGSYSHPLAVATVSESSRIIVVDCNYAMGPGNTLGSMQIESDSIRLYVIEHGG